MKTKSKISVYILRSAAAVLLLSCVIVAFSSAITPTATGEPTSIAPYTPGGAPGPWMQAAPVETDHYGGFMDSDGTFAYEGGGYSFTINDNINQFGRFDPVANTWTALAPVPDLNNSAASGVYAPNLNKLFVFGGENVATTTVVNTTRIYDMATNTWSIGAPMPDVRDFMGSGYFNGRIYLVGGYNTGNVDPSFGQVWEYDPVANTFNTSRASMPITMGGPGFGIINGHIYIAGGRNIGSTNLNTLYDYDIAANTWTQRANLPTGINVPGSAVIGGKLWVFGGGDPFVGSGALPKSNQKDVFTPDATNILQIYDPATNTWSSGPTLNQERSFPAGTHVGGIAVAVGGYTGSTTTTSVEINVAGSGTPTPTATATHTPTPTPTGTHTPTATPTATSTATPTATATAIPPPSVTTNAATNVTSFSATLNGTINPNGFPTNVHFEYGTTTGYGSTTVSQNFSGSTTQPVSADISGLSPNITYHFRLVGMNGGGTSFGGDMTFTTVGGPPTVTTNAATSVTSSSATLNGTVNPNGLPTNVHFDYGTTTNYGSSTAIQSYSGSTTQPVSANIPGLSPNTTYHFRLVGTNNGGTSFGYDVTFRFDTNTTGPVIITNAATSVMSSSATLNGTVNPKGLTTSVYFQYGASASYGFTTVAQSYSASTTQPVSANIPGLGPSTTYHFRLVGVNSGGTSFGNDRTFTTSAAAVPPVITSPATARATVNQLFVYQITATAGATSYTAMPVPAGMTFDGVRGILGGTPMNPGTTQIQLTASNSIGTGMRTLTLTVQSASNPGLTIASGTSITARKGQFFSFEVFTNGASRNARLSATGLPAGVRADAVSGLISGTPTANGSFGVTLTVTDGSVTKTSTLQLVFTSDPAIPVISSPREATLVPGHFFSYRIVDSSQQSGTTFSVTGQLPPGLTLNPVTGVISGVYSPHGDDPLQNGGNPLGNVQTNTHHGSQHASNPLSYFQQRPCTLLKVATRGVVQSGNNQLLGRVNVAGNVSENVMVRAIGPSLRVNGVPLTGRLQNPMLELDHPYSIGRNDDWHTTVIGGIITSNQVAAIQNSHLLNGSASLPLVPTNPLESAIIANALAPGNYSAIVRPKSGTTGTVGSVEFYDLGPATLNLHPTAQLANFSTRSLVQTGNNVMRTDFTLGSRAGTGSPVTILLRAVGPSLSVQGRLLNPTLRLYNGTGVSIAYNDNWMSAPNHQAIVNSGYAPTNNLESAILMTLSAGNYTAVVGGQNNTTGIAQVEAYILP